MGVEPRPGSPIRQITGGYPVTTAKPSCTSVLRPRPRGSGVGGPPVRPPRRASGYVVVSDDRTPTPGTSLRHGPTRYPLSADRSATSSAGPAPAPSRPPAALLASFSALPAARSSSCSNWLIEGVERRANNARRTRPGLRAAIHASVSDRDRSRCHDTSLATRRSSAYAISRRSLDRSANAAGKRRNKRSRAHRTAHTARLRRPSPTRPPHRRRGASRRPYTKIAGEPPARTPIDPQRCCHVPDVAPTLSN